MKKKSHCQTVNTAHLMTSTEYRLFSSQQTSRKNDRTTRTQNTANVYSNSTHLHTIAVYIALTIARAAHANSPAPYV